MLFLFNLNMSEEKEKHIGFLKLAEQQFRLACTVNLAVGNGVQTLDVPVKWSFGQHIVSYEDFGLRPDQADYSAAQLEMTTTFVMADAIRNAIVALFQNRKNHENENVKAAYQISRLIRNAFAHNMVCPKWSIDSDCQNKVFEIENVITLNTKNLHGKNLEWPDYGGLLAIFYLGRYVREKLLNDRIDPSRRKPDFPKLECYQQGRMVLIKKSDFEKAHKIPEGIPTIEVSNSTGAVHIGNDHWIVPIDDNK